MKYYYYQSGEQKGPVDLDALKDANINADTLIWHEGLPEWKPASEIEELHPILEQGRETPPVIAQPPRIQHESLDSKNVNNGSKDSLTPPPNYLVWAILVTIFCCWPLGIPAIVYAAKVNGAFYEGRHEEAYRYRRLAFNWIIASLAVGVAIALFYIILLAIGILSFNDFASIDINTLEDSVDVFDKI